MCVDTLAQQNSASSEELASSSEELTIQAEKLKEVMPFFKIPHSETIQRNKPVYKVKNQRIGHIVPKGFVYKLNDNSHLCDDNFTDY